MGQSVVRARSFCGGHSERRSVSWTCTPCTLTSASSHPWIRKGLPFPDGRGAAVLLAVVGLFVGAGPGGASSDLRGGASAGVEGGAGAAASQGRLQVAGCRQVGWKGERADETEGKTELCGRGGWPG